jgi:hypothetical protein
MGGMALCTCRLSSPLASMSRTVWVSIFFEIPGKLRSSTPVRAVPP